MFKSGQKEVTDKDFYKQRQITDIFRINVKIRWWFLIKCHALMERAAVIL